MFNKNGWDQYALDLEEVVVGGGVALRIGALPLPGVLHHLAQLDLRAPAQLLLGLDRVGVAGGNVACMWVGGGVMSL